MKYILKNIKILLPEESARATENMAAAVSYLEAKAYSQHYHLVQSGLKLTALLSQFERFSMAEIHKSWVIKSVDNLHKELSTLLERDNNVKD